MSVKASKKYINDTELIDGSDLEFIGKLRLKPGELKGLTIGIFENNYPQPHFHVNVSPDNAAATSTLLRIDDNGEYKLVYHFQNFQNVECAVSVYRCSQED